MQALPTRRCIIDPMPIKPYYHLQIIRYFIILLLMSGISGCYSANKSQAQEEQLTIHSVSSVTPASLITTPLPSKAIPSPTTTQPQQSVVVFPEQTTTTQYITHQVIEGDTLLGIALQYGKEVDDIINANPGLDPNLLSIGITISIPLEGGGEAGIGKPTPIPIELHPPWCYQATISGLTCLVLAENNHANPVENVTAEIILQTHNNSQLIGKAFSPLDIIPPTKAIPLVAHFSRYKNGQITISMKLSTAQLISRDDSRYIEIVNVIKEINIRPDQLSATVRGEIRNTNKTTTAQRLWLFAVAYDQGENPVGYRKRNYNNLSPNEILLYEITVYSLGPLINSVDVLAEAKK
jgi:LysM repeat protein